MKILIQFLFLSIFTFSCQISYSQKAVNKTTPLFQSQETLPIKLKFSIKDVKKNSNDSTYVESILYYKNEAALLDSIQIKIRARGNYRRENCYYVPLKLKLKKSVTKGTLFTDNKELKLVLPCLEEKYNNDYVVKEYMAYKLYEIVSPFHFKTRLVNIELMEEKGSRIKDHEIKGIFIEDIENVANRCDGKVLKRLVNPLQQDDYASLQNSFFQYLIGNTDFSTKLQHNEKLLFIDKKFIIVPYDFDMSGLVDASYAVVSNIQNLKLNISEVTQRAYKGYQRDELILQKVREEYINHKTEMFDVIDSLKDLFHDSNQFLTAKQFIAGFFDILENDKKFKKNIIDKERTN